MTAAVRVAPSPLLPHVDGKAVRRCPWWPACRTVTQNGAEGESAHIVTVHQAKRPTATR